MPHPRPGEPCAFHSQETTWLACRDGRHRWQAFREALAAAGFTGIGSTEELSGDGYWHHYAHTIRPADPDELRAADRAAAAIAEAYGVRYDEWMVGRDHKTDELRPASSAEIAELMKQDERSFRLAQDATRRATAERPDD